MKTAGRMGFLVLPLLVSACSDLAGVRGDLELEGNEAATLLSDLRGAWSVETGSGTRTLVFDRLATVDVSPYLLGHDESELPVFARFNRVRRRLEVRGSEYFAAADDESAATRVIPSTQRSGTPLLPLLTANYFDVTRVDGTSIAGVEVREDGGMGDFHAEVSPRPSLAVPVVELSQSVSVYDNCVASVVVGPDVLEQLQQKHAPLQLADLAFLDNFYGVFGDAFDFIVLVPDTLPLDSGEGILDSQFIPVQTLARGTGRRYDNRGLRLQGVIILPDNRGIAVAPVLHELAHNWANSFPEISDNGHWGRSDVDGVLGGSDIGGRPAPEGVASNTTPFAPLELYLMGLIDRTAVRDVQLANGSTVSIESLIHRYGEREPGVDLAQKSFRMAVVVFGPTRPTELVLQRNCQDARWFSLDRDDGHPGLYNFWKATGGRAHMLADRLLDAHRPTSD